MPNEEYQRLLRADPAELRERLQGRNAGLAALAGELADDELRAAFRDLGGHDIGKLIEAYQAVQHDRPTVIFAYTIKGWSLPIEGHPENHSALLTAEQFAELAKQLGTDAADPWAPFDAGSPEGELAAAAAASARARGAEAARAAGGAGLARPKAPREGVDPAGLRPLLRRPRARRARRSPSASSR